MTPAEIIKKHVIVRDLYQRDMKEIKKLHQEWFPLDYPSKFYNKVLKKKGIIAKGCFIKVTENKK